MKTPNIPIQRKAARKGTFRKLFANVARQRHMAATASTAPIPEVEGDVPSIGVSRALVVILLVHVLAIAGIIIHSRWFEEKEPVLVDKPKLLQPIKQESDLAGENLRKFGPDDRTYTVGPNDSYASIAAKLNVSEQSLRAANDGTDLRNGIMLLVPEKPRVISASEPAELTAIRQRPTTSSAMVEDSQPPLVPTTAARQMNGRVVDEEEPSGDASQPVMARPKLTREQVEMKAAASTSARAATTQKKTAESTLNQKAQASTKAAETTKKQADAVKTAGKGSYAVKSGDTIWHIAQANKTTPAALMKANGIKDPSKLRTGMVLKIPQN
jgi:LysM repeat protein